MHVALIFVKDILVKVKNLHVNATMVSSHDRSWAKITLRIFNTVQDFLLNLQGNYWWT